MLEPESKIKVVKSGTQRGTIRADELSGREEKRQRELKKIKDELLTLARRVDAMANEAAQVTTE